MGGSLAEESARPLVYPARRPMTMATPETAPAELKDQSPLMLGSDRKADVSLRSLKEGCETVRSLK